MGPQATVRPSFAFYNTLRRDRRVHPGSSAPPRQKAHNIGRVPRIRRLLLKTETGTARSLNWADLQQRHRWAHCPGPAQTGWADGLALRWWPSSKDSNPPTASRTGSGWRSSTPPRRPASWWPGGTIVEGQRQHRYRPGHGPEGRLRHSAVIPDACPETMSVERRCCCGRSAPVVLTPVSEGDVPRAAKGQADRRRQPYKRGGGRSAIANPASPAVHAKTTAVEVWGRHRRQGSTSSCRRHRYPRAPACCPGRRLPPASKLRSSSAARKPRVRVPGPHTVASAAAQDPGARDRTSVPGTAFPTGRTIFRTGDVQNSANDRGRRGQPTRASSAAFQPADANVWAALEHGEAPGETPAS